MTAAKTVTSIEPIRMTCFANEDRNARNVTVRQTKVSPNGPTSGKTAKG